ncbi:sulfatase family protein [Membranihabitans marinus]|uniref:sulfatase family protein n=1 Tax=Membranihabitans marinus TaxID=1227546 RepID=UPI001F006710|nr:sulfatase-like hydrolase/transferase [Membranihabitans marinus]
MKFFYFFCALVLWGCNSTVENKPNIVFIFTDDQASWTINGLGNDQAYTPHIDQLIAEGGVFENAFVTTPVCSPSRASLMTGQYATELGILDFIPHPRHRLFDPNHEVGLDSSNTTFAELIQKNGYTTGLVGKYHLGDWTRSDDKRHHPLNQGFDYFMGLTGGGESPVNPVLEKDGVIDTIKGLTTDILTDHALSFIDANKDDPFLLCLNYRAPHSKWLPVAEEDWAPYENLDPVIPNPDFPDLNVEKVKRKMKEYLASVSGVDRNVGRVLEQLKQLGLEENTIVIFTSDHGYNMGHNGIEHKGNGYWILNTPRPATENLAKNSRPNLYDHSLRVPAIVKWPNVIKPGLKIKETQSNLDWFPTLLEMTQTDLPKDKIIRGKSVLPLLKGEKVEDWSNDFYAEYSMINYSTAYMRSYRSPEWKLIVDFKDTMRNELYHLEEDPEENHNLYDSDLPEVVNQKRILKKKIMDQMTLIDDVLLLTLHEH